MLRRRLDGIEFGEVTSSFVRVLAAGLIAGAAAYVVWKPLDSVFGRSLGGQLIALLPALLAAVVAYLAAARALKVREMQALLSLRSRLRRG